MKLLYKLFTCVLLIISFSSGCTKNEEEIFDTPREDSSILNEPVSLSFTVNNKEFNYSRANLFYQSRCINYYDGIQYHYALAEYQSPQLLRFSISFGSFKSPNEKRTTEEFKSLFNTKTRNYNVMFPIQNNDQVRIDFLNEFSLGESTVQSKMIDGNYTEMPFQPSESFFIIDSYFFYTIDGIIHAKLKGRFNCTLYKERSGNNPSAIITNGNFVADIPNE